MCRDFGSSVLACDAAGIVASAAVARKETAFVILPGRDFNMSRCSINYLCSRLAAGGVFERMFAPRVLASSMRTNLSDSMRTRAHRSG
jgi:hypothetical protein